MSTQIVKKIYISIFCVVTLPCADVYGGMFQGKDCMAAPCQAATWHIASDLVKINQF